MSTIVSPLRRALADDQNPQASVTTTASRGARHDRPTRRQRARRPGEQRPDRAAGGRPRAQHDPRRRRDREQPEPAPDRQPAQGRGRDWTATNSDLAFQGKYAFAGNYDGFVDLRHQRTQRRRRSRPGCSAPGSQNDISVHGDLLFLSTDSSRSDDSCDSITVRDGQGALGGHQDLRHQGQGQPAVRQVRRDGLRLTHPHAGAGQGRKARLPVRLVVQARRAEFPDCKPPHDNISIVKVPLKNPTARRWSRRPMLFPDGGYPGGAQRLVADHRLPRHHRLPGEGPRRRRLHGRRRAAWTSPTRTAPKVINGPGRRRTSRSGTRRPSTTPAPR